MGRQGNLYFLTFLEQKNVRRCGARCVRLISILILGGSLPFFLQLFTYNFLLFTFTGCEPHCVSKGMGEADQHRDPWWQLASQSEPQSAPIRPPPTDPPRPFLSHFCLLFFLAIPPFYLLFIPCHFCLARPSPLFLFAFCWPTLVLNKGGTIFGQYQPTQSKIRIKFNQEKRRLN